MNEPEMNTDDFYRKIVERLAEVTNGNLFEACAADLLRAEWPTLLAVPGGNDAGLDGAWVDEGGEGLLVSTVGSNVIGNVTKNLKSHLNGKGRRRRVLVVTTQSLSARQCRNIETRVATLGFRLAHHPYTLHAVAARLYHNSRWCKELLGLSGLASALGKIPKGVRPLRDLPLVGRDAEYNWLTSTNGDRLLIGQPGIGKTYLLQKLVDEGKALFVIDDDVGHVADSIRDQQPTALIVEDAHLRLHLIEELCQYRASNGASFEIIADCWPAASEQVRHILTLSHSKYLKLEPLDPKYIVELVNSAGISGPTTLIHILVRQSLGCPGLAAMLVHACLSDNIVDVWHGEQLGRWARTTFAALVGDRALQILAGFAIGGKAGMEAKAVAELLGYPRGEVLESISKLAMGGVVHDKGDGLISVVPEPLRCSLVKQFFYDRPAPLPILDFLERAPNLGAAVQTLIGASWRGANIPPRDLLQLLVNIPESEAWEDFARCGPTNAKLVIEKYPDKLQRLARPLLYSAPNETLPRLLDFAGPDNRELHQTPDHPLRVIRSWIESAVPGHGEAIERRSILLNVVMDWLSKGNDHQIGLKAIASAFSIAFEDQEQNPSDRMSFTFRRGILQPGELIELGQLWPHIADFFRATQVQQWDLVLEVIDQWVYCGRVPVSLSEEHYDACLSVAKTMIADVTEIAINHPGVASQLTRRASDIGLVLQIPIDEEFAILFPGDSPNEHWQEHEQQCSAAAHDLASKWISEAPDVIASKLLWCISESEAAGFCYPNYGPYVCSLLAENTNQSLLWVDALLHIGAKSEYVTPFLAQAATRNEEGWHERAINCLVNQPPIAGAAWVVLTQSNSPESLVNSAIKPLAKWPRLVEQLCMGQQISNERIMLLLRSTDSSIAAAAAVGLWSRSDKSTIPDELRSLWRKAVLAGVNAEYRLCEMMKADRELAFEWLLFRATTDPPGYRSENEVMRAAATAITREERQTVLAQLGNTYTARRLARALVGDDVELYKSLLANKSQSKVHLVPLHRLPDEVWATLAVEALDAGYSIDDVTMSSFRESNGFMGSISSHYEEVSRTWSKLEMHDDERIRRVSQLGQAYASDESTKWKLREKSEEFGETYLS